MTEKTIAPHSYQLSQLRVLESEAVHIIREVAAEMERPCLLFSGGKDSAVMLHVAAKAFAPALSASLFGILFGAPLLGYIGDRFGRKAAILAGCTIYGLGTLATVWTTNLDQVVVLRFLAGIGIGGLMPNTIALNSELAPKRLRAALVVLMFTGITTGGGIPGYVQAWLIPHYGWQITA